MNLKQVITLSFLSHKNFSFCAFLCINTPSRWPVSADRISIALFPQPIIWPVLMYAENTLTINKQKLSCSDTSSPKSITNNFSVVAIKQSKVSLTSCKWHMALTIWPYKLGNSSCFSKYMYIHIKTESTSIFKICDYIQVLLYLLLSINNNNNNKNPRNKI